MSYTTEQHRTLSTNLFKAAYGKASSDLTKDRTFYLADQHKRAADGFKSIFDAKDGVVRPAKPMTGKELSLKIAVRKAA